MIRPNPYARKDSGSFFTPQELVDLIVDRTLKPLVEERLSAFEKRADEAQSGLQAEWSSGWRIWWRWTRRRRRSI